MFQRPFAVAFFAEIIISGLRSWLRLKLLKWKVHCSNPLVTGSNLVGAKNSTDHAGRF